MHIKASTGSKSSQLNMCGMNSAMLALANSVNNDNKVIASGEARSCKDRLPVGACMWV